MPGNPLVRFDEGRVRRSPLAVTHSPTLRAPIQSHDRKGAVANPSSSPRPQILRFLTTFDEQVSCLQFAFSKNTM